MKRKRLLNLFMVFLILSLTTISVVGESEGPQDIRDRVNNQDLNILEDGDLVFLDKNGNVIENPTVDSVVTVNFQWRLDEEVRRHIQDGDFFEFKLPDSFKINALLSGNLEEYGTFEVRPDLSVVFYFNENVTKNSNVKGFLSFTANLNREVIDTPGDHEIVLPFEKENTVGINIKPTSKTTQIEKEGVFDLDGQNPNNIRWDIIFNKTYENLNNVIVEEIMPEGLTVEQVQIFELILSHEGDVLGTKERLDSSEYDLIDGNIHFKNAINKPYRIQIDTKINEEIKPALGGDVTFFNEVWLHYNETNKIDASATLSASYGKLLEKYLKSYDSYTQVFSWEILYNFGDKTIENGYILDTLDQNLELIEDSFKITNRYYEDLKIDYSIVKKEDNKFEIIFNEALEQGIIIQYDSKVKDGYLVTGDDHYFSNKVETTEVETTVGGHATQGLINKHSQGVNYKTKKISWLLEVNRNNYLMKDYTITDTFKSGGLTLDEDSFKVHNATKNIDLLRDEYALTVSEDGFVLNLLNDYETTSDNFIIYFDTDYDINAISKDAKNVFVNDVNLEWTDQYDKTHSQDSHATQAINLETINNGRKVGSYNAVSKEITWQTDLNYTSETLDKAVFTDKVLSGQEYVENSLEISRFEVSRNGTINVDEKLDLNDFKIDYPNLDNDYTFTVHLPKNSNDKYSIKFKTSVESEQIRSLYKNKAIFSNGTLEKHLDASVSITHGDKFVSKEGMQDQGILKWQIAINESQSTIRDGEIHDFPCGGQLLLEDSFNLYPVIVNESGNYIIDEKNPLERDVFYSLEISTLENGHQSFVLKFLDTIDRTYVLKYESQLNATKETEAVTNKVIFRGNEVQRNTDEEPTRVVVDIHNATGGATGEKGSLTIKKVNPQGMPLQGVEFELHNSITDRKIMTLETDEEGIIIFNNLVYGPYTLFETKAKEGYVIDDALAKGLGLEINEVTSEPQNVFLFENRMNELKIKKQNINQESLAGATFELKQEVDGAYKTMKSSFTVEEDGVIFYGLPVGNYRLFERKANDGYVLNTKPLDFTIDENMYAQAMDKEISFTNYQGSVILEKTDENKTPLANVIFNLYTDEDVLIKENLKTDEAGKIEILNSLSPGTYYFKEVSSVEGHIVNENPIHFTIASKADGELEPVKVFATNYKGSVQFKKVAETNYPLANVEFTLFDENDNELTKVFSQDDGMVRVDHLEPGSYYFKETESLEPYIKNTEKLPFVIPEKTLDKEVLVELENFVNYRGGVIIKKIDTDGKPLQEARFKLLDDEQKTVKKFSTIEGEASLENLSPGNYSIVEIEAPKGYVLSEEPFEFTIVEEFEGAYKKETIEIVNKKSIEPKFESPVQSKTPSTGIKHNVWLYALVIVASGIVLSSMILRKIKNKNSRG